MWSELAQFLKKYKLYLFIALGVVLIPMIINYSLFTWRAPYVDGDWSGFLGNYVGGIIGGVVALLVAQLQIKHQKNIELENRLRKQLPYLHEMKQEILKIRDNMEFYAKSYHENPELEDETIYGKHRTPSWNKELFIDLSVIVDETLMLNIMRFRSEYSFIWDSITADLEDLRMQLIEIKKDKVKILFDSRIPQRKAELNLLVDQTEADKKKAWESISSQKIVSTIDNVLKSIDSEIARSRSDFRVVINN